MPPVLLGPRCNRRVTCDVDANNDRSESTLEFNPRDPYNMVGASKRFSDYKGYKSVLAAYFTFDGGQSWGESPPLALPAGATGATDPAVAWDDVGGVYLVSLPEKPFAVMPQEVIKSLGIAVYKSTDGGRTWSAPNVIHTSDDDDKQSAGGDTNPLSPHHGNVYIAWDDSDNGVGGGIGNSILRFARTTDYGLTWKGIQIAGVDQPAGTNLPGITDSGSPEVSVASDGMVYIAWTASSSNEIKFVKSTDGGATFSAPLAVASNITILSSVLPMTDNWPHFPTATFRVITLATVTAGSGGNVVVAWPDGREGGMSRIYYRRSTGGGDAGTWQGPDSGQPLLTGAVASDANKHDFQPQLACTPNGEIGCAFYEYGPTFTGGEFPHDLVHVYLAVSTDNGATFPNRVWVTDTPWDPKTAAPWSHNDPNVTFIGEYFGLAASSLGFFPFWLDTRSGVQEMFTSRIAVNPSDVYIRDSSSDVGVVPYASPDFWEAPDLIVRHNPDGGVPWVNQPLVTGVTTYYVYGKVNVKGPNDARNVRLAVTVGNYPSLQALPGAEFRYPQDWYQKDWATAAILARHTFLGETAGVDIPNGSPAKILGPLVLDTSLVPDFESKWHPCLLAEVRCDNDDSAGGGLGCDVQVSPGTCDYGSYFWGNNNVCQRNLSYIKVKPAAATAINFPFIVGSVWSKARFIEVIVDKGRELAEVPMTLRMEPICPPSEPAGEKCPPGELVLVDGGRVVVRVGHCDVGEIVAAPGTIWRVNCPPQNEEPPCQGSKNTAGGEWKLPHPKSIVGFPMIAGERLRMTLSFTTPATLRPDSQPMVRIFQRNDGKTITGNVLLELLLEDKGGQAIGKQAPQSTASRTSKGGKGRRQGR